MKREYWKTHLISGVLSWLLGFGAVGCLATAFRLDTALLPLALYCAAYAFLCSGAFCFRWGGVGMLCLLGVVLGYLWQNGTMEESFSGLLYELTRRYDNGYGIGVWGDPSRDVDAALWTMAALIILSANHAVCRQVSAAWAVSLTLIPLSLCVVVNDTVPAEGMLLILFFAMTMLVMTSYLRQSDPTQANRLTLLLAFPLAAALGLAFWLMPRSGYDQQPEELQGMILEYVEDLPDNWEELEEEMSGSVGGSRAEEVDLTQIGPMRQYTYPVLDVVAPQSGVLYLREQDYDVYDGTGWESTDRRREALSTTASLSWPEAGTVTITTRRERDLLLLPYYPQEIWILEGGSVENEEGEKTYGIVQYVLPDHWYDIATETGDSSMDGVRFDGGRYLEIPEETQEGLEPILAEILTDEQTATEKAQTIAAFVRGSATYDLNTPRMDPDAEDFVLWFLEESETGYCVHFATTTVVLLRTAGVEARYVTGYMIPVRAGEETTVTEAEAHAWVEYYEPRLGAWIPLESTPSDPNEEEPETTLTESTDAADPSQTTQATHPSHTTEPDDTEDTGISGIGGTDGPQGAEKENTLWLWIVIPLLILAIPGQWRIRLSIRRRKWESGDPNSCALAMWQDAERFSQVLGQTVPKPLEELAQKASFSQHTLTLEELQLFRDYLSDAEKLCREKPIWRQFVWRVVKAIY